LLTELLTEDDDIDDPDDELELELRELDEYELYELDTLIYTQKYLLRSNLFRLLLGLLDLDLFRFLPDGSTTNLYPCIFLSCISFTAASAS
jgi:hypothetical protein